MRKTFKYRIYPSKRQESLMIHWLGLCCELYNSALKERREAYKLKGISITYYDQAVQLPEIKRTREDVKAVHAQVLQDSLRRLDKAFQAFFRRLKNGENPGFPRYRSSSRYVSFIFAQNGFRIGNGRLFLSKIGKVKINLHRPIEGKIKTCQIKRTPTGKWFACFSCEVETTRLPSTVEAVGIDAGLETFATLSNGEKIKNPRFLRKEEKELIKAQKKLSASPKGSKERKHRRKIVARRHERIVNKRNNFAHQESRKIVNKYGIICMEDLKVINMSKNHSLAKSIADAAWSQFFKFVIYKAEEADRLTDKVPPAHTSTDCHRCGNRKIDLKLSDRIYHCPNPECGLVIDRDINAAKNILALGLQRLGFCPRSFALKREEWSMKILLLIITIALFSTSTLAQQKKSLTMDDVDPSTSKPSATNKTDNAPPKSEEERLWQLRVKETELRALTFELQSALNESNSDMKKGVEKERAELARLLSEGNKKGFRTKREPEVDYRKRYVKLRLEMIKEEKLNPPPAGPREQVIYKQTRRSRGKLKRKGKIGAPTVDTKTVNRPLTKLEKMEEELDDLIEEGRRENIPPGIFRDDE